MTRHSDAIKITEYNRALLSAGNTFRGATDRNRCVETFHRLKMITEE